MALIDLLPHRHPFLFIDKIINCQPGVNAKGIFVVSADNPYLIETNQGVVFPQTLLLEAMAQVGAIAILSDEKFTNYRTLLTGLSQTVFHGMVHPGDELVITSEIGKIKGLFGQREGEVLVNGSLIAQSSSSFALIRDNK
jgi:3-hydroxyacyl-[acyl-carrier-protein] dehydratase